MPAREIPDWLRRLDTVDLYQRAQRLRTMLDEDEDPEIRRKYSVLMGEYERRIREGEA